LKSKERVKRAIKFQGPDRIPLRYAFDPERSDIVGVGYAPAKYWSGEMEGEDEWGCVWDKLGGRAVSSFGQVKIHPIKTLEDYKIYEFPDPCAPGRFDHLQEEIEKYRDKYIAASMGFHDFNRLMFLRGMENLFEDLIFNKDVVIEFLKKLVDWQIEIIKQYLKFDIDGIWFGDDWGTQKSLMIAPSLWREIFKPEYKRQFDLIHSYRKDVIFHSCGYVWDIIDDLIEIGVNAFNFNQPLIFSKNGESGIDRLSREFGGKVCFICPLDMQRTLIEGTYDEMLNEAKHLIKALGKFNGGFIACCDEGIDHGYIPINRIQLMGEIFEKLSGGEYVDA